MKVLVVGSGGREHALAWKIAKSPRVKEVFVAPGNAGTALVAHNVSIAANDIGSLARFAESREIDLTVVGPELPLTLGIVDEFQKSRLRIFGPTKAASRLESSKAFTKNLLRECGVPTADFEIFTDPKAARTYVKQTKLPVVVKADGLAAGKGVVVCQTAGEADAAIRSMMEEKVFGSAGETVIIEDCLVGEEATFMALTDGRATVPLATSQDHKRVGDGDTGPNTGGMGACSPAPVMSGLEDRVMEEIIEPVLAGLEKRGVNYQGLLYAGLMIEGDRVDVLEFNVRFGDPECQAILPRLQSDLVDLLEGSAKGKLGEAKPHWSTEVSACIVLCERGYPGARQTGAVISGLERLQRWNRGMVFHAGTSRTNRRWLTSGGRVLAISALGSDLEDALREAYAAVSQLHWEGMHCRTDIGAKALARMAAGRGQKQA